MYESAWMVKDAAGADRRGCMACGAHVLVGGRGVPRCRCCGSRDLRSVDDSAVAQHGRESADRSDRSSTPAAPATSEA
jgi:hypothetical protein